MEGGKMSQTFQQVSKKILKEMEHIPDNVDDLHIYFYELKKKFPKQFERLLFDTNGFLPYSEDLCEILSHAKMAGQLNSKWSLLGLRNKQLI